MPWRLLDRERVGVWQWKVAALDWAISGMPIKLHALKGLRGHSLGVAPLLFLKALLTMAGSRELNLPPLPMRPFTVTSSLTPQISISSLCSMVSSSEFAVVTWGVWLSLVSLSLHSFTTFSSSTTAGTFSSLPSSLLNLRNSMPQS